MPWHHERVAAVDDLTLAEAATILSPPITEQQLRAIISALGWRHSGARYTGRSGRPVLTYPWADLSGLHAALVPWLEITYANGRATHPRTQVS